MNTYPRISIITPSYNQGQYIEQTIQSVLDQGYPNLEYIVIDGGSTDDTTNILKKYDRQIAYWVSELDEGQSHAINKGFQRSTGEIINWLNSDDFYEDGCLFKLAESFRDPHTTAVTTTVHNFEEGGEEWDERTTSVGHRVDYIAKGFNNQPGTFFRKEVWNRYFPIPTGLRYTMDQYLWLCYWMEHDFAAFKIEQYTTAHFRRHSGSKTSTSLEEATFHHLGKVFFNEHNLLFWSFFVERDQPKADVIASYFYPDYSQPTEKIIFPTDLRTDCEREQVFASYLFELLKEDFRIGNFKRLKANFPYINSSLLTEAELLTTKKMRRAIRFPKLLGAYRKLYWANQKLAGK